MHCKGTQCIGKAVVERPWLLVLSVERPFSFWHNSLAYERSSYASLTLKPPSLSQNTSLWKSIAAHTSPVWMANGAKARQTGCFHWPSNGLVQPPTSDLPNMCVSASPFCFVLGPILIKHGHKGLPRSVKGCSPLLAIKALHLNGITWLKRAYQITQESQATKSLTERVPLEGLLCHGKGCSFYMGFVFLTSILYCLYSGVTTNLLPFLISEKEVEVQAVLFK